MATDAEIEQLLRAGFTPYQTCRKLNMSYGGGPAQRFRKIAKLGGFEIARRNGAKSTDEAKTLNEFERKLRSSGRAQINVTDGIVLVGSDAHYWPGIVTTAHRAFVRFAAELKPVAVIMNGDGFDGASISRFARIGWDNRPTVKHELEAVEQRLAEIEVASRTKQLFWPLGNHDARFETFLASQAPQYEGVEGFHLKDRFPLWKPCWSVWVNECTVVKHRFKGGIHATHNNTLWSGRTMVCGHLHSLKVTPLTDYGGTRFGVDTGTLAEPSGPQFTDYTEQNPLNWRSGFVVLTYHKGKLLWPEVAHVIGEGQVEWRGGVINV